MRVRARARTKTPGDAVRGLTNTQTNERTDPLVRNANPHTTRTAPPLGQGAEMCVDWSGSLVLRRAAQRCNTQTAERARRVYAAVGPRRTFTDSFADVRER
eukprot:6997319-Pyramimonas_sp.AAC.1